MNPYPQKSTRAQTPVYYTSNKIGSNQSSRHPYFLFIVYKLSFWYCHTYFYICNISDIVTVYVYYIAQLQFLTNSHAEALISIFCIDRFWNINPKLSLIPIFLKSFTKIVLSLSCFVLVAFNALFYSFHWMYLISFYCQKDNFFLIAC